MCLCSMLYYVFVYISWLSWVDMYIRGCDCGCYWMRLETINRFCSSVEVKLISKGVMICFTYCFLLWLLLKNCVLFCLFCLMIIRMTSFSIDKTSKWSCSSLVLGKRKPVKPPPSVWEHFIKVEWCDPKYPGLLVNIVGLHMLVIPNEIIQLILKDI